VKVILFDRYMYDTPSANRLRLMSLESSYKYSTKTFSYFCTYRPFQPVCHLLLIFDYSIILDLSCLCSFSVDFFVVVEKL
jgi:hypothetical protein